VAVAGKRLFLGVDLGSEYSGAASYVAKADGGAAAAAPSLTELDDVYRSMQLHTVAASSGGGAASTQAKEFNIVAIKTMEATFGDEPTEGYSREHLLGARKVLWAGDARKKWREEVAKSAASAGHVPEYDVYVNFKKPLHPHSSQRLVAPDPNEAVCWSLTRPRHGVRCVHLAALLYGELISRAVQEKHAKDASLLLSSPVGIARVHVCASHPNEWDADAIQAARHAIERAPVRLPRDAAGGDQRYSTVAAANVVQVTESAAATMAALVRATGAGDGATERLVLAPGDTIMTVDVGAGTVDISCHTVGSVAPLVFAEQIMACGYNAGGSSVDDTFVRFLRKHILEGDDASWDAHPSVAFELRDIFIGTKQATGESSTPPRRDADIAAMPRANQVAERDLARFDIRAEVYRELGGRGSAAHKALQEAVKRRVADLVTYPARGLVIDPPTGDVSGTRGGARAAASYVQKDGMGSFGADDDGLVIPTHLTHNLLTLHRDAIVRLVRSALKTVNRCAAAPGTGAGAGSGSSGAHRRVDHLLFSGSAVRAPLYQTHLARELPTAELASGQARRTYHYADGYSVQCSHGAVLYQMFGATALQQRRLACSYGVMMCWRADRKAELGVEHISTTTLRACGLLHDAGDGNGECFRYLAPLAVGAGDTAMVLTPYVLAPQHVPGAAVHSVRDSDTIHLEKATEYDWHLYRSAKKMQPLGAKPHLLCTPAGVTPTGMRKRETDPELRRLFDERVLDVAENRVGNTKTRAPRAMDARLRFLFDGDSLSSCDIVKVQRGTHTAIPASTGVPTTATVNEEVITAGHIPINARDADDDAYDDSDDDADDAAAAKP